MKLIRIIGIFACLLLLCSFNDYPKDDGCKKSDLKGKIKTLTEIVFYEFSDCERHISYRTDKNIYVFDRSGKILEYSSFGTYNSKPALNLQFSDTPDTKDIYIYDNGKLIRKEENRHGRLFSFEEHSYDTKDRKATILYFIPSRERVRETVYSYKGKKIIEKSVTFEKSDTPSMTSEAIRDTKGHVLEIKQLRRYSGSDTFTITEWGKFNYDSKGNLSSRFRFDRERKVFYTYAVQHYDKHGNILRVDLYDVDASPTLSWIRKYDESGMVLSFITEEKVEVKEGLDSLLYSYMAEKVHDQSDTIMYKYENIDVHGNYLRKIATSTKAVPSITERTIEYYDKKRSVSRRILKYQNCKLSTG